MFQTNTFFGTELMVAPIVEKMDLTFQSAKVDVWFPEGEWYDFFSEKKYTGGVKLSVYRDISTTPVFAKVVQSFPWLVLR